MHEIDRSNTDAGRTQSPGGSAEAQLVLTTLVVGLAVVGSPVAGGPRPTRRADHVKTTQGYVIGNINGQKAGSRPAPTTSPWRRRSFPPRPVSASAPRPCDLERRRQLYVRRPDVLAQARPARRRIAGKNHSRRASHRYNAGVAADRPAPVASAPTTAGGRMSYLRFEDQADGVHVFFDDVTDAGPVGTVATFNETDIATLGRTSAHHIRFAIDFVPGPATTSSGSTSTA